MRNKLLLGAIGIAAVGAVGAVAPTLAYAATNMTAQSNFVQKLATNLGLDATTVQNAVTSTKDEIRAENVATRTTEINQAVTDGKLTQRQADILIAMMDVQPGGLKDEITNEDWSSLIQVQRQAKMQELKTQRDQKIVDVLNTKGLNTTLEEVQAAMTAAKDAGLAKRPGFGRGFMGGFGPGL